MSHDLPEDHEGKKPRWPHVKWPLVLVGICFLAAWGALFGPRMWTNNDPLHLIHRGTADERQKAALDLGAASEGRDIDKVIASLVRAMEDSDVVARSAATDTLSAVIHKMLRRPAATPEEQSKYDRRVALAVPALTKALADREPLVRASAASGFGLLGSVRRLDLPPQLITELEDESTLVRSASAKALHDAQLTIGAVPGLLKALQSRDREVRFAAAKLLGRLGPAAEPSVPALLATLKEPFDRNESEKTHIAAWTGDPACSAARSLGQIGASQPVVAGLIELLSSDVNERASSAASALADLGPKAVQSVPALIVSYDKVLTSKQHLIGQSEISRAIGQVAPRSESAPRAVAILIRALDSRDWSIRNGAIEALGKFGADAAAAKPKLREIELNDPASSGTVKAIKSAATAALAAIETHP